MINNAFRIRTAAIAMLAVIGFLGLELAHAQEKSVTLDVAGGTSGHPVGAGYDNIGSAVILKLTLQCSGKAVTKSELVANESVPLLWRQDGSQDKWITCGVRPNDKFYAVFRTQTGGAGGGGVPGAEHWDYGSVSDVDIDAETLNHSTADPRVPTGSRDEDEAEYATGDTSQNGPKGLIMGVSDGQTELPWCRVDLALDPKTDGTLTLTWPDSLEMKISGGAAITSPYNVESTIAGDTLSYFRKNHGTPLHPQYVVRPKTTTTQPANVEIKAEFVDNSTFKAAHGKAVDIISVSLVGAPHLKLAVNQTDATDDDMVPLASTPAPRSPVTVTLMPTSRPPGIPDGDLPYAVTIAESDASGNVVGSPTLRFWNGADPTQNDPHSGSLSMSWASSDTQQKTFYTSGTELGVKYVAVEVTGTPNPKPTKAIIKVTVTKGPFIIRDDDGYWNYAYMEMPGKTDTEERRSRLLIGVRNDDKAYFTLEGMRRGDILYEVTPSGGGAAVALGNFAASDKAPVSLSCASGSADYNVKYVLDNNANGTIDGGDTTFVSLSVLIFSRGYRNDAISVLTTRAGWADALLNNSLSALLLYDFIDKHGSYQGGLTASVSSAAQDVRASALTHNCGASFPQSLGIASVPLYVFGEASPMSSTVAHNSDFVDVIHSLIRSHENEVKTHFAGKADGYEHSFEWPLPSSGVTFGVLTSGDLFAAIYHASAKRIKVLATYKMSTQWLGPDTADLKWIKVWADVEDLYDFNYYGDSGINWVFPADKAAALQVGWGRGVGAEGRINTLLINVKADESCWYTVGLDGKVLHSTYYNWVSVP